MHVAKNVVFVFAALVLAAGGAQQALALSCGDTLTSDTTLTANLACSGTALVVGADGITIDLNGYTISGDGTGLGIDNTGGYDNVTIKNGTITGFQVVTRGVSSTSKISTSVILMSHSLAWGHSWPVSVLATNELSAAKICGDLFVVRASARSFGDKSSTTNLLPTVFGQTLMSWLPATPCSHYSLTMMPSSTER